MCSSDLAGEDLSAFAGMKASSPDKAGLNLAGVDFALAVASDKDDTTRRWTTLQANADSIALTGITGVTMASSDLAVTINRAANDGTIADYSSTPLTLNTATGSKTLNINSNLGALVEASGTINIAVSDFFTVNGSFAVRSARDTVTLSNSTTVDADLLDRKSTRLNSSH